MKRKYLQTSCLILLLVLSCQSNSPSAFRSALTFYVSFDNGATADFALGDVNMYTAKASYVDMKRELEDIQIGMNHPNHSIASDMGRFGDAFEFGKERSSQVIFYKSLDNIEYDKSSWSGSISFWLSVNPSSDLKGYTDPIQITDINFNDASIWVDFTDHSPPHFRLGVIGDKNVWTLDTLSSPVMEVFNKRTVDVESPPFSRNSWTHVLITYKDLGTSQSQASLYLNGKKQGEVSGIADPFSWEIDESNIFLGLGFTGLMDELSIFKVAFSDEQAMELYKLNGGIKSIL